MREIVGPDGGCGQARVEVDLDGNFAGSQINQVPGIADATVAADLDPVDTDVDLIRIKDGVGGTNSGQNTAPVGVITKDGGFEQVGPGH